MGENDIVSRLDILILMTCVGHQEDVAFVIEGQDQGFKVQYLAN
jgi:hypothetical protein